MLISLKVPDEVFEAYGKYNPQNPRLAMEQALTRFVSLAPNKKNIVLTGDDLTKVQDLLSTVLEGPKDFIEALTKALTVKVEGVDVAFTESQRKALKDFLSFVPQADPKEFTIQKIKEGLVRAFGV